MAAVMDIDALREILVACAGEDEAVNLDGDVLDRSFEELAYDSLALIECAARIKQLHGVEIPDDALVDLRTPRALLDLVNGVPAAGRQS
ncbi:MULTISPECIES: acyl carrier protein [unclassified Embleya]|uniref:acyl carrier protein n=1 Tax=unclassified Embleya TaxID=2699296 RepID=UPI00340AC9A6